MVTNIQLSEGRNTKKSMRTSGWIMLVAMVTWVNYTDAACTKFTAAPDFDFFVEYEGSCIYAFSKTVQYATAETICSDEGARLVHYEDESKQTSVAGLLGSSYNQHWMGLKFMNNQWQWWDVLTGTGTTVTSTRWEGGSSGACAYTQTSNMGGLWKAVSLTAWYRPVCEDGSGGAATTTATTTTPPASTGCSRTSFVTTDNIRQMAFKQETTLVNSELMYTKTTVSNILCASRCLSDTNCCYFTFHAESKSCRFFRYIDTGFNSTCLPTETCFGSV